MSTSKETTTTMRTKAIGNVTAPRRKPGVRALASTMAILMATAILAVPIASADQKVAGYTISTSTTQAGGHPDLTASFSLEKPGEPEIAKTIEINLPEGLFGNPGAIEKCESINFVLNSCSAGSQTGLVTIFANYAGNPNHLLGTAPVYNLVPQGDDETARLGFTAPTVNVPVIIPMTVRSATDYGVRMSVKGIPQSIPLYAAALTVWGFPAETAHDPDRFHIGSPGLPPGCPGLETTNCNPTPYPKAAQVVRPYINNPTVCTSQPLPASVRVTTYEDPAHPSEDTTEIPATTGCEKGRFDPILNVGLTTVRADSPSGLDLQLKADQFLDTAPSPSQLRSAIVSLPEGLSINPDAADGQTSCSDAQANFRTESPGNCPDNSKIGTFDITTPALEGPLVGSLYIGEPRPGNQYRIFMIANGFGVHAKFEVKVDPDPSTGRLTMSVTDLPQVPFEEFNLHLFASDRGLVATPIRCTIYTVAAQFVPWNDKLSPQRSDAPVSVTEGPGGSPCPGEVRPFHPRLVAGSSHPIGGDFSDFRLRLDRDDGDQFLGDLNFTMPPGLTATLRGVSFCPESAISAAAVSLGRAQQAAPSCPASSGIGTTNVAAGPGSHPFHAVGKMYLAGPFKGAPLSVVAVTPALAGPYDYGTVVVRVAIHVDPQDAHVVAVSDIVPAIIGGIPIRMRSIQVNIDKPNFMINPTSCAPYSVASQGIGDQGTVTDFSSFFQVVNCTALPFKPKMTVRQIGRKATRRAKNPQLQFDLRTRPGDANIKSLTVTLSHAFEIDQRHLGNICSEKELTENQCAGRTPIGKAVTTTPLLDQPLSGPAYAVSGSGGLPRLAFILNGQVNLVPRADTTTTARGQLKTTVPVVPDAPIGHFRLNVFGGKTGYLINTRDICTHTPVINVAYAAQNGKTRTESVKIKAACGKKKARAKRHR